MQDMIGGVVCSFGARSAPNGRNTASKSAKSDCLRLIGVQNVHQAQIKARCPPRNLVAQRFLNPAKDENGTDFLLFTLP